MREESFMDVKPKSHFGRYIREIRQYSLLSREEETLLAREIKKQRKAIESFRKTSTLSTREEKEELVEMDICLQRLCYKMIQANFRLVIYMAKKYRNPYTDLNDLVEEGNIALIRAVEAFDIDRGCRFSTFAT